MVSYAPNGQLGASSVTRQRVLDLAKELEWYPSSSARALSGAETGAVGLVLSRPSEALAASVLLDLVEGRNRGWLQVHASILRVRETTAPPAAAG